MKSITIHHIVGLMVLLFLSCNLNDESGQYDSSFGILPLKTGNTWQYFQQTLDSNGNALDTSTVTMSVIRSDSIGSFKGYSIRGFYFWFVNPVIFANRADGLYTANIPGIIFIPLPPPKIEKTIAFPTFRGDTLTYSGYLIKTRNVNETLTVKAGTYSCIVYDIEKDNHNLGEIWMAPYVGIIKSRQQIGIASEVHELQSFRLY